MSGAVILNDIPGKGVVVVTQVNPTPAASAVSARRSLEKFLRVHPKCLGTVEITIGVITVVLGISLTIIEPTLSVCTGFVYWGSVIYIVAGSLSVAAGTKLSPCLVKASLGMNVVSAMVGGISFFFLGSDVGLNKAYVISGILLGFSILQFIISICISAFGCKATCCIKPVEVIYITNHNPTVNNPPTEQPPPYTPSPPQYSP